MHRVSTKEKKIINIFVLLIIFAYATQNKKYIFFYKLNILIFRLHPIFYILKIGILIEQ